MDKMHNPQTWEMKNNKLSKEFVFDNFIEAVDFINQITPLAEKMNHHPDIFLHSYKKVIISLFTHTENTITKKDYTLAEQIDDL